MAHFTMVSAIPGQVVLGCIEELVGASEKAREQATEQRLSMVSSSSLEFLFLLPSRMDSDLKM